MQIQADLRTGLPTGITGRILGIGGRAICSELNAKRVFGIREVSQFFSLRKSLPPNDWASAFIQKARRWSIPLIPLSSLGLTYDEDGFIEAGTSDAVQLLMSGTEAWSYLDPIAGVVYKLFGLRKENPDGKLVYELSEDGKVGCRLGDATLEDTATKLVTLHDAGGHPTEIVGLSSEGQFLIAKQPFADPLESFEGDLKVAVRAIKGLPIPWPGSRGPAILIWVNGSAWIVSDLHDQNIMRDGDGRPTIIDALTGGVPRFASKFSQIRDAMEDARDLREGRPPQTRFRFGDGDDQDL